MARAKPAKTASGDAFLEFGATGLKQYSGYVREEWLRDLVGRQGILMLREMRDNDPIIGAIFFAIEMLLRGVSFHVEGASTSSDDQESADFVQSCLADMEVAWPSLLAEILSFLHYGWSVHETVYKIRRGDDPDPRYNSRYDDGMIGWRKFAIRAQETCLHWVFDTSGDATHLIQLLPTGGPLLSVPLEKCIHVKTTPYKGNPEGRPIIRNAYTSYYYKKKIMELEAIGVQRDLTGLPIAWIPTDIMKTLATPEQKAQFEAWKKIARDVSRNEQEGLVLPLAFDDKGNKKFDFTLLATGGRRQFPTDDIIQRYDTRIAQTVLGDFITLGGGGHGSYAQSRNKTDMFSVAVKAYLDLITAEFNRKAIPDLLRLNGLKGNVQLAAGDIARRDLHELGNYIFQLAQAGILIPDETLEAHAREEAGLPAPAQDGSRDITQGGDATGEGGVPDPADRGPSPIAAAQGRGGMGGSRIGKRFGKRRTAGHAPL